MSRAPVSKVDKVTDNVWEGAVSRFCESGDSMWVAQWIKAQLAVVQARSTVRVFKIDATIRKPFRCWADFRRKPSGLRRSHAANTFRKGIPNRGINFIDTYRITSTWSCTGKFGQGEAESKLSQIANLQTLHQHSFKSYT